MAPITTELILTIQQLQGIGNKTIFKIVEQAKTPITSLPELCDFWKTLKGKKLEAITNYDLEEAYSDPS